LGCWPAGNVALGYAALWAMGGPHITERFVMKIDRELFLSTVLALSLGGLVGCSSEEPPAAAEPQESYGSEEPAGEAAEATEGADEAATEGEAAADEAAAGDEGAEASEEAPE